MKIYYTSRDIEELAAKGVKQLEVSREVTLTDFARETALQVGIELVTTKPAASQAAPQPASPSRPSSKQLGAKPKGCQHGSVGGNTGKRPAARPQSSGEVNDLVDLVGKLIKQGD
jgi:hypothetical protein